MGFAGIYELDGETLKITFGFLTDPANQQREEKRPTSFDPSGSGSRKLNYRLKRVGD
jgi:hypothetical protein